MAWMWFVPKPCVFVYVCTCMFQRSLSPELIIILKKKDQKVKIKVGKDYKWWRDRKKGVNAHTGDVINEKLRMNDL